MVFRLRGMRKWLVPEAGEAEIEALLPLAREARFRPYGTRRPAAVRLGRMLRADSFIPALFRPALAGDSRPGAAAENRTGVRSSSSATIAGPGLQEGARRRIRRWTERQQLQAPS